MLSPNKLKKFDVHPERGFLPTTDPPQTLPSGYAAWEQAASELPKLLITGRVQSILKGLPFLDASMLKEKADYERGMLLLSYLGHAYVWGETKPADHLPPCIAAPWYEVSCYLGRPPILSYASYALWNWKRIDADGPIALGNIALLQNFLPRFRAMKGDIDTMIESVKRLTLTRLKPSWKGQVSTTTPLAEKGAIFSYSTHITQLLLQSAPSNSR
ncbi:MAG: hypothetical protein O7E52_05570 [Candidatus Poribacteria bacterium]|nr:hypothetical protein [Candidatus Poribacteria bacterium]